MGVGDGQGILVCCSPWSHKELDTTEWLNWTEYMNAFPHQKTWSMCVKSLWHPHPPNCVPLSRLLMCIQFGRWISRHHSLYLPMYVLIKNILNVYQKYLSLLLFLTQQYDLEVFRNSYIEIDFIFFNYCMGFHSINMTNLLSHFLLIFSHFHY